MAINGVPSAMLFLFIHRPASTCIVILFALCRALTAQEAFPTCSCTTCTICVGIYMLQPASATVNFCTFCVASTSAPDVACSSNIDHASAGVCTHYGAAILSQETGGQPAQAASSLKGTVSQVILGTHAADRSPTAWSCHAALVLEEMAFRPLRASGQLQPHHNIHVDEFCKSRATYGPMVASSCCMPQRRLFLVSSEEEKGKGADLSALLKAYGRSAEAHIVPVHVFLTHAKAPDGGMKPLLRAIASIDLSAFGFSLEVGSARPLSSASVASSGQKETSESRQD